MRPPLLMTQPSTRPGLNQNPSSGRTENHQEELHSDEKRQPAAANAELTCSWNELIRILRPLSKKPVRNYEHNQRETENLRRERDDVKEKQRAILELENHSQTQTNGHTHSPDGLRRPRREQRGGWQ